MKCWWNASVTFRNCCCFSFSASGCTSVKLTRVSFPCSSPPAERNTWWPSWTSEAWWKACWEAESTVTSYSDSSSWRKYTAATPASTKATFCFRTCLWPSPQTGCPVCCTVVWLAFSQTTEAVFLYEDDSSRWKSETFTGLLWWFNTNDYTSTAN